MLNYGIIIDKVMNIGLEKINTNSKMDIDELFRKATNGENRTVKIIIHDDNDKDKILWERGLCVKSGKIVPTQLPSYTITYKIPVSAWYRLISKENTFTDLVWSGKVEVAGDFFARDIVVWKKFWTQYADTVFLNYLERKILKSRD